MKRRIVIVLILVLVATALTAQEPYSEGLLGNLGLETEEIQKIQEIQRESAAQLRVKRAELEVKKAQLARLLVEDNPAKRAIERNLRETAEIEVEIRLVEIERELEIRRIVGLDRWTRIAAAVRDRRSAEARASAARSQLAEQLRERLSVLQRTLEDREELVDDEDIRRQFDLLREEYRELQELIRERL